MIENTENNRATFNVVISYHQPTKAVVTWQGFNKDTVREEITEHFSHIPDLVIETIDMVEGMESNVDNIVEFKPKEIEQESEQT